MSGIGHNSQKACLQDAASANVQSGVLMLCKEALVTAIQDRRLERGHLKVLAAIVTYMNNRALAWPGRLQISIDTKLKVRHVSNLLLELRQFGYLIADRECVPEADNRRLTVYTFGNIDHETIRRQIADWVMAVRDIAPKEPEGKSPPTVTPDPNKVTAHGEHHRPRGLSKSPPTVTVPAHGEEIAANTPEKSPPTGDSNSKINNIPPFELAQPPAPAKPKRNKPRSQIAPDWEPSEDLVLWVRSKWVVTDRLIQRERDKFYNHHLGKGSLQADWPATWRTWWENDYHKIPRRAGSGPASKQRSDGQDLSAELARLRAEEEGEC